MSSEQITIPGEVVDEVRKCMNIFQGVVIAIAVEMTEPPKKVDRMRIVRDKLMELINIQNQEEEANRFDMAGAAMHPQALNMIDTSRDHSPFFVSSSISSGSLI